MSKSLNFAKIYISGFCTKTSVISVMKLIHQLGSFVRSNCLKFCKNIILFIIKLKLSVLTLTLFLLKLQTFQDHDFVMK